MTNEATTNLVCYIYCDISRYIWKKRENSLRHGYIQICTFFLIVLVPRPMKIQQTVYVIYLRLLGTELCLCRPLRSGKTIALLWHFSIHMENGGEFIETRLYTYIHFFLIHNRTETIGITTTEIHNSTF